MDGRGHTYFYKQTKPKRNRPPKFTAYSPITLDGVGWGWGTYF